MIRQRRWIITGYNFSILLIFLTHSLLGQEEFMLERVDLNPFPALADPAIAVGDVDGNGYDDLIIAGDGGVQFGGLYYNYGDGNFVKGSIPSYPVFRADIELFDADLDGDLDVIATGNRLQDDFQTRLLHNLGDGTFEPSSSNFYSDDDSYEQAGRVETADLNGDDYPDILVSSENWNSKVYFNDGNGNFDISNSTVISEYSKTGALVDIDSDGDIDIVLASGVFLNDGFGDFTESEATNLLGSNDGMAYSDFNGDGLVDFLLPSGLLSDEVTSTMFLNQGGLMFAANDGINMSGEPVDPPYISNTSERIYEITDLDLDGDLDIVYSNGNSLNDPNSVKTSIYTNLGDGKFIEIDNHGLRSFQGCAIASGQFVGDSSIDLVIVGRNKYGQIDSELYEGSDNLEFEQISRFPFPDNGSTETLSKDFNGDGILDLFISGRGYVSYTVHVRGTNLLYLGSSEGKFYLNENFPSFTARNANIEFLDLENDGDLDITLTYRYVTTNVPYNRILQNDGQGNFEIVQVLDDTTHISLQGSLTHAADLNGDGFEDLIISNEDESGLFFNDGNGFMVPQIDIELPTLGAVASGDNRHFDLFDYEDDGDWDIISSNGNNDYADIYLNDGEGLFSEIENSAIESFYNARPAFVFEDMDNDGDKDIVVSGGRPAYNNNQTGIYENLGSGNYLLHELDPEFGSADGEGEICVSDLDQNGYKDIIVFGSYNWRTDIYLGFEDFLFIEYEQEELNLPDYAFGAIESFDADFDGDPDLLLFGSNGGGVKEFTAWENKIFENTLGVSQKGKFAEKLIFYPNPSYGSVNIVGASQEYTYLDVYSTDGTLVWSQPVNHSTNFDLPLKEGLYILRLSNSENSVSSKLLILPH